MGDSLLNGFDLSNMHHVSADDIVRGLDRALSPIQGLSYVVLIGRKGDTANLRCIRSGSTTEAREMMRSASDALASGSNRIVRPG